MSWFSRSGGIIYHLRAIRYARALWRSHQEQVENFLKAWNPKSRTLILIGPSAAYSLPTEFLKQFEAITAYEPDPVARFLFNQRWSEIDAAPPVHWIPHEFNPGAILNGRAEPLFTEGAILFCNVLGQIEISDLTAYRKNLMQILKGREWASYHDGFSGSGVRFTPLRSQAIKATEQEVRPWTEATNSNARIEINQHQAFELFPADENAKFYYWEWRLSSKRAHLIEGVFLKNEMKSD